MNRYSLVLEKIAMTIKAKTEYAYWALVDLALHRGESRPVRLSDISERYRIPEKFLLQVMASLKQAGLVTSIRGQQGGYTLARPPARISLADVFRATGVELAVSRYVPAVRGAAARRSSSLAILMTKVDSALQGTLEGITLEDGLALETPREGPTYVI